MTNTRYRVLIVIENLKERKRIMTEENLISLVEYAKTHGINSATARRRAQSGKYKTARLIGRNWVIDKNEPHIDYRIKSGKYIDARKRKSDDR